MITAANQKSIVTLNNASNTQFKEDLEINSQELHDLLDGFDIDALIELSKNPGLACLPNPTVSGILAAHESLLKQEFEVGDDDFCDTDDDDYMKQEDYPIETKTMMDYVDDLEDEDEEDQHEVDDLEEILRNEKIQLQQMYPELLLQNPSLISGKPKKPYKRRESLAFRREQEECMLLPFRTKRYEKVNNNGEEKQIKAEAKRVRVNERVKKRQRLL